MSWRPMQTADLMRVFTIANQVHPTLPEDVGIFAERQKLYPKGCLVWEQDADVKGYVLSHPWRLEELPALNTKVGRLPTSPNTYFVHDIAMLPEARGHGAASAMLDAVLKNADDEMLAKVSLVAVGESHAFWEKHGFGKEVNPMFAEKLSGYGEAAAFMVKRLT